MKNGKKQVVIGFREATAGSAARIDIEVPSGVARADLAKILVKVIPDLEKLRPRGCTTCLSGLDINIRERFEHVLTLEL